MSRLGLIVCALAVVVTGCRLAPGASPSSGSLGAQASAPAGATSNVPLCDEVPPIEAPPDRYRDEPIYVFNEQPEGEVRGWAKTQPGFEASWIDREHLGWVTLAFSEDADQRQADLERLFPEYGVVAVQVDWTMKELQRLQRRVMETLAAAGIQAGGGILQVQGVVWIDLGYLDPADLGVIEREFGDERICVSGADPSLAPAPGPQQWAGDGWQLLAAQRGAGNSYEVAVATEPDSYAALWSAIGLAGEGPTVDFQTHVVFWFGAVYGSSCPDLRMDDVVIDLEAQLVHPDVVLASGGPTCTSDARPFAFVVAVERSRLPAPPFAVQLAPDVEPGVHPAYRQIVEVDLRQPGAVAQPGDIHPDQTENEPSYRESGAIVEPGFAAPYRFSVRCGIEWLGILNAVAWKTDAPPDAADYVPAEWEAAVDANGMLEVSILLEIDPEPTITATANGHSVTYRPVSGDPPSCN